jgi:hypothetical protein
MRAHVIFKNDYFNTCANFTRDDTKAVERKEEEEKKTPEGSERAGSISDDDVVS